MSELATPDPIAPDQAAVHALRREIRTMVRRGRQARGLTQTDLGKAVGTSRFTINRVEMGSLDLAPNLADHLQQVLDTPELVLLVAQRERLLATTQNERDLVVRRMLSTPSLEKVTIACCDDLDIYGMIFDNRRDDAILDTRRLRVIFPTVERERQLFGSQPLYGHIEYQIKRLADLQGSEDYSISDFQLFESDKLVSSFVIASTRTGTECAFWPPVPIAGKVSGASLPVSTTVDPNTTGRFEAHAEELIRGREPIHTNEALCKVEQDVLPDTNGVAAAKFTRYFAVASDQEEDVEENEGFAVALVLALALCTRKHYGVARRVVTYNRPGARQDRERLSLFSNNVDDDDIRAARAIGKEGRAETSRSTRGALAAALDINNFMLSSSGVIPDAAYKKAAAREFAMFDLHVSPERLTRVSLPKELSLIRKPATDVRRRAAVVPRLFTLELEAAGLHPELDTLRSKADVEELGTKDMMESTRLNDFLSIARQCGFLIPLLERLGVAEL